jgi:Na+/H+ antiporter NhaA
VNSPPPRARATTSRADPFSKQTEGGRRFGTQLRDFIATQNASAVILLAATVAALIWANSPWSASYERVWSTVFAIRFGDLELSLDLRHWINDGLMAFFFFVVGLEIRREFDMGELRERRRVATPVLAAMGGMVVPALIYLAINAGKPTAHGWGIPMGTDTAFALGVLTLVGGHWAIQTRTYLLTLVIVDDIAALVIIALAYTSSVSITALAAALALFIVVVFMRNANVRHGVAYFLVGSGVWLATLASGIHPTIAGVAIGFLATAYPPTREDLQRAGALWRLFREEPTPEYARTASRTVALAISPNERLQHLFHPWTSFVIVPLFALANAGVNLAGGVLERAVTSSVTHGIILGLVAGKPIGITVATWLFTRRKFGGLPLAVPWPPLIATASVGGIGFTVALLVAIISLSGENLDDAKVGILTASVLASFISWLAFHIIDRLPRRVLAAGQDHLAAALVDLNDPVDNQVDHLRGPENGAVALVEYGDFECPNCGQAEPVVRQLLQTFGDDLTFVFRHLPLIEVHEHAQLAAEAAEAAEAQGKFWEMHDVLFAHQDALDFDDLLTYAGDLGLDMDQFTDDLRSERHAPRVERDMNSADESGVTGTPTFFINGRRHYGAYDLNALRSSLLRETTHGKPRSP